MFPVLVLCVVYQNFIFLIKKSFPFRFRLTLKFNFGAHPKLYPTCIVLSVFPDSVFLGCTLTESVSTKKNAAAAAAKSLQSRPTLCDPIDSSPPGSPVPGILPARTLDWVTISFSNAWKWKVKGKSLSRVLLLATPWTAAYQAPPSMGFSRQEYWSGVPLPSPSTNFFFLICLFVDPK